MQRLIDNIPTSLLLASMLLVLVLNVFVRM